MFSKGRNTHTYRFTELQDIAHLQVSELQIYFIFCLKYGSSAEQYRTSSDFNKCVISPGDTYVAAGSADGHIFIWNLLSTRLEKVLYKGGHEYVYIG